MSPVTTWLIDRGVPDYIAINVTASIESKHREFDTISKKKAAVAWVAAADAILEAVQVISRIAAAHLGDKVNTDRAADTAAFLDACLAAGYMKPQMRERIRALQN